MGEPTVTCGIEHYDHLRNVIRDICKAVDEVDEDNTVVLVVSLSAIHKVIRHLYPYTARVGVGYIHDPAILFHDDGVSMLDDDVRYEVTENDEM